MTGTAPHPPERDRAEGHDEEIDRLEHELAVANDLEQADRPRDETPGLDPGQARPPSGPDDERT